MTSASNHENLIGTELFSHSIRKLNKDFQSLGQQTVKDYDSYEKGNEGSACLMTGLAIIFYFSEQGGKQS